MADSSHMTDPFKHREIEIIVHDGVLDSSTVEPLIGEYILHGSDVVIRHRWGGPGAQGLTPEIAVVVIVATGFFGALGADLYRIFRSLVIAAYQNVRLESSFRPYTDSLLALRVDSDEKELSVYFMIPRGLSLDDLRAELDRVEADEPSVLSGWESDPKVRSNEIYLAWDPEDAEWQRVDDLESPYEWEEQRASREE